jgi:catechol 2,3-dioxygenase-like lactoylglutathione lyase family enzyme
VAHDVTDSASRGDHVTYLDHLTIFVRDLGRSRDWYTTALGLKREFDVPAHNAIALQDSGGFTLFLEQRPAEQRAPSCALTFRVDAVKATYQSLITMGIRFERTPQTLFWGFGAELRDPGGYLIRLWDEASMGENTEE